MDMADFTYSNLPLRPIGPFLRAGSLVLPGVRRVQRQIVPYAEAWQRHNAKPIAKGELLWVVLGDSMAQGIGAKRHDQGWVGQLDSLLQEQGRTYRLVNLSISGARIRDVLDIQLPVLKALGVKPDLITVMVGSNDLVRKKYRVDALTNFDELLEAVPEGSVVANLLGKNGMPMAMDLHLQQAAKKRHLAIADVRGKGPKNWRGMVAEDFFHPNETGYAVLAQIFNAAIHSTTRDN
jgi:lysophospholipase L1-like esterase